MSDEWDDDETYDTNDDLILCPECKADIYAEAESCPKCGYLITHADKRKIAWSKKEPSWLMKLAAIGATVLIGLAILGFLLISVTG